MTSTNAATNLLTRPLLATRPLGPLTLPGVLAALARDEVEDTQGMRPHQCMFWHMFCVQLGALALLNADRNDIPTDEPSWCELLRSLTRDFPGDEPWTLVVDDWSRPAFMQPPVPADVELKTEVPTPDALDLLITSRNHDLKQAVAVTAMAWDWIYALVALQTGEGYGGRGNQGIVRMNGGSSSRVMLSLAPVPGERDRAPRAGAWFRRDLAILLARPEARAVLDFPERGGLGLTWLAPWPEGEQLKTPDLDCWFIEVCRRVRFTETDGRLAARKGISEATRIDGKALKGVLGDPWAPVHKAEAKTWTLGEDGNFDFKTLVDRTIAGEWELPLLAIPTAGEAKSGTMALVAQAIARGNSKTGGFRRRVLRLPRSVTRVFASEEDRRNIHTLSAGIVGEIGIFDKALGYALALAVAGGDTSKVKREAYAHARSAQGALDRFADGLFFEHLWRRHNAADAEARAEERKAFVRLLWERTQAIFEDALPMMPCASLVRPRAENAARGALRGIVMKAFSDQLKTERTDADAA